MVKAATAGLELAHMIWENPFMASFPVLKSVTSHWESETCRGWRIYTLGIRAYYKSGSSYHRWSWFSNILQNWLGLLWTLVCEWQRCARLINKFILCLSLWYTGSSKILPFLSLFGSNGSLISLGCFFWSWHFLNQIILRDLDFFSPQRRLHFIHLILTL